MWNEGASLGGLERHEWIEATQRKHVLGMVRAL